MAAPVVGALLRDARLAAHDVDGIVLGATTVSGNPARLVGLAAGLRDTTTALTVDRQCASGLDAILSAMAAVAAGHADVMVAGGADSASTAPWRIARPKSLHHMPHFLSADPMHDLGHDETQRLETLEELAARRGIDRDAQDAWVFSQHQRAEASRETRRLVGEIVALKPASEEARDESVTSPTLGQLAAMPPLLPDGIVTWGAMAATHDGAAAVLVVSERRWIALGRPASLTLVDHASIGVTPEKEAQSASAALTKLKARGQVGGFDIVELGERSAVEALAFAGEVDLETSRIGVGGGAVVRGHPLGATGAVLVVRLFGELVRHPSPDRQNGLAALGALGGLGVAAAFAISR